MVSLTTTLNYEVVSTYTLSVTADDGSESTVLNLTVSVTDVDESPVVSNLPATVTVSEDDTGGGAIFTVAATDEDTITLAYTLTASPATSVFSVDAVGRYLRFLRSSD